MDGLPRLPLVRADDPELAELFSRPNVSVVPAPNVMRVLAGHPRLLRRVSEFVKAFTADSCLPARERELVILRTAWRAGCEYELAQHRIIARREGLTDDHIASICTESAAWPEAEDALIGLVDELHAAGTVSDETWERVQTHLDDAQLIQLFLLAGFYRDLAGLLTSARVPIDEGLEGPP